MLFRGSEIIEVCGGRVLQGNPGIAVTGCAIDSREAREGSLFVPLPGERTDGHRYVAAAARAGAVAALHSLDLSPDPAIPASLFLAGVPHPLLGLQQLAAYHRRRFDLPVIAVTGSSGKTTTKDYIAGVLQTAFRVLKTEGNLNNEIGLPLTLLRLEEKSRAAVVEMAMRAPGEIFTLCTLAAPTIGVITNIGRAHIEKLGSVDAIAAAKGELLDYLGSGGVAVLNGDDPRLLKLGKRFPGKVYYYGFNQGEIRGFKLSQRGEKTFFRVRFPNRCEGWFETPLPGRESAANALAALTVGYILGLSLAQMTEGLKTAPVSAGRLQVLKAPSGLTIIDDTYNANPASVRAALDVLAALGAGKGIAVLGDMLELGSFAAEDHRAIGRYTASCSIGGLVTVGTMASLAAAEAAREGIPTQACSNHAAALDFLAKSVPTGGVVLVKGSRAMRMEEIVKALLAEAGGDC